MAMCRSPSPIRRFPHERQLVHMPARCAHSKRACRHPHAARSTNLTAGARVYVERCAFCHGLHGKPAAIGDHMYPDAPPCSSRTTTIPISSASATTLSAKPTGKSITASDSPACLPSKPSLAMTRYGRSASFWPTPTNPCRLPSSRFSAAPPLLPPNCPHVPTPETPAPQ